MKEVIIEADVLEGFCGLKEHTLEPSDITLPVFVTDEVQDAQGRALDIKNLGTTEGWVYKIRVTNAKYRQITNRLSILLEGNITIEEVIHVKRNPDGQIERLTRTKI